MATPPVGAAAPSFDLPADDGQRYSLAGLRGRRVVLYFYPRDNTPGCTAEACEFSALGDLSARGVVVLGVSADSLESHADFRRKFSLTIPLLSDPDHDVATRYGAFGRKTLYGRTFDGMIRSTFVIDPEGRIEQVYAPVRKAAGHAAEVLAALPS
jgi:peroxiredoxin Q/BCP